MLQRPEFSEWYERPSNGAGSWSSSIAEEAFQTAQAKFESDLTNDPRKVVLARSATTLEDVEDIVQKAMQKYNASRSENEARGWLVKLSRRVHLYGSVLDVFAQHHPEYVALAWGSMKFLLMAVLNHEDVITTLAKAIAEIAWTLPRVELQSLLYPTDRMKVAVTNLYACILQFLIRARGWYEEGKRKRFIHSITRPVELRYRDLLDEITSSTLVIDKLATSGSQAEIRDLHRRVSDSQVENRTLSQKLMAENQILNQRISDLQMEGLRSSQNFIAEKNSLQQQLMDVTAMVGKLQITMFSNLNLSIDTNYQLTSIQLGLSMAALPNVPMLDPDNSYRYNRSLSRQRAHSVTVYAITDTFWRSQRLQDWSSNNKSIVSVVAGSFQARFVLRDLCVGIIEQLKDAKVPTLFAMRTSQTIDSSKDGLCSIDILKSLSRQAMDLQPEVPTERYMATAHARVNEARTETEWFQILETFLIAIKGTIYIIIDFGVLNSNTSKPSGFMWTRAFQNFFERLSERGPSTKVKVLFISYGILRLQLSSEERSRCVIPAKVQLVTARQRKAGRVPRLQQRGFRLGNL